MEKIKGQLESYKEQPFSLVRRLYPHSWNTEPFTGDVCLGI